MQRLHVYDADKIIDLQSWLTFRHSLEEREVNITTYFLPQRVAQRETNKNSLPFCQVLYQCLLHHHPTNNNNSITISSSWDSGANYSHSGCYVNILSDLITAMGMDIESPDSIRHCTLLHRACEYDDISLVTQLLNHHGANLHVTDINDNTALMYACMRGNLALTRLLLDFGAEVNITNDQGDTPLHLACKMDAVGIVGLFLSQADTEGLNVNAVNNYGETILQIAASLNDKHCKMLSLLLNHPGIDINMVNPITGLTALDDSILTHSFSSLKMLLPRVKITDTLKHRVISLLYHQLKVYQWDNSGGSSNATFSTLLEMLHVVLHLPTYDESKDEIVPIDDAVYHIHYHAAHFIDELRTKNIHYLFVEIPAIRRPEFEKQEIKEWKERERRGMGNENNNLYVIGMNKELLHLQSIKEKVRYSYEIDKVLEILSRVYRESRPNPAFYDTMTASNYYYRLHCSSNWIEDHDITHTSKITISDTSTKQPSVHVSPTIFGEVMVSFLIQNSKSSSNVNSINSNQLSMKVFAPSNTFEDIFAFIHSDLGIFPDTFQLQHRISLMDISMEAFGSFQIQELFGRDIEALDLVIIQNQVILSEAGHESTADSGSTKVSASAAMTSCEEDIPLEVLNYNEEDYESDVVYDDDGYYDDDECNYDEEES